MASGCTDRRIELAEGVCVTVWLDHLHKLGDVKGVLSGARPKVVMIHDGPRSLYRDFARIAGEIREVLPGVQLWAGVGCDGWLDGKHSTREAIDEILSGALAAVQARASVVVWDAEAAYKIRPLQGAEVARGVMKGLERAAPMVTQGFTSYDHPTMHSKFPWRAWLGPEAREIEFFLPQIYVANPKNPQRGALQRRAQTSAKSWAKAVAKGWVREDIPRHPYIQAYGTVLHDLVEFGTQGPLVVWWSVPNRMDETGNEALVAVCELRKRGYTGPDAIRRAQHALGVKEDGIYGPITHEALMRKWVHGDG